jgi:DNA-binding NarL/FixJ family response regulator
MKNKILLVDDHPLVREWLANLINSEPEYEVCGQVGSAPEALELTGKLLPAIVIADLSLAGGSGLELIKQIKAAHPQVSVIVLSMHDETLYAERVMRAGASGYIMKREATDKVLEALQTVLAGKLFFSHAINALIAQRLVTGQGSAGGSRVEELSDRELEVFQLLGCGCTTRQISEQMNISFKTVQVYCGRIKEKLALANINELISHAVRWHENQSGK